MQDTDERITQENTIDSTEHLSKRFYPQDFMFREIQRVYKIHVFRIDLQAPQALPLRSQRCLGLKWKLAPTAQTIIT